MTQRLVASRFGDSDGRPARDFGLGQPLQRLAWARTLKRGYGMLSLREFAPEKTAGPKHGYIDLDMEM